MIYIKITRKILIIVLIKKYISSWKMSTWQCLLYHIFLWSFNYYFNRLTGIHYCYYKSLKVSQSSQTPCLFITNWQILLYRLFQWAILSFIIGKKKKKIFRKFLEQSIDNISETKNKRIFSQMLKKKKSKR